MEATAVAISSLGKCTREEARSANADWTSAGLRACPRRLDGLLEWAMQSLPPACTFSSSAPFRGLILTRVISSAGPPGSILVFDVPVWRSVLLCFVCIPAS